MKELSVLYMQHVGRISDIIPSPTYTLTISEASEILQDCAIGDSICVNGACLTVTEFDATNGWFKVGLGEFSLSVLGCYVMHAELSLIKIRFHTAEQLQRR